LVRLLLSNMTGRRSEFAKSSRAHITLPAPIKGFNAVEI